MLVAQSCQTLCTPIDCNPPGSSVHGILQARILDPSATACDLSGRANWSPEAEVLWAPSEAAGSPISNKRGGWAWFDGETLNFLVHEALLFINSPISLGLIHGLGKYLSLKLSMPRLPYKHRNAQGSHLWEKNWLSKWLERDNNVYNQCNNTSLVPTMVWS